MCTILGKKQLTYGIVKINANQRCHKGENMSLGRYDG